MERGRSAILSLRAWTTPILNFWSVLSAPLRGGARPMERRRARRLSPSQARPQRAAHARRHEAVAGLLLDAISGPIQHRQLRIVEFPGYAAAVAAQSFPTMIPYSEDVRLHRRQPRPGDDRLCVVHHRARGRTPMVGASGGRRRRAGRDSSSPRSLAEYSALMVVEHRYGAAQDAPVPQYELDTYLRQRGQSRNEQPLARAAMDQTTSTTRRARSRCMPSRTRSAKRPSTARWRASCAICLQDRSLSDLARTSCGCCARRPGHAHQQLITDLFERITLWDLRRRSASEADADRRRQVAGAHRRAGAQARRRRQRRQETEAPLDQPIDIGLFAADPGKPDFSAKDVIALEKRRIVGGTQSIEFVVDRKPAFVGIDPYIKLISRNTANNVAPLSAAGTATAEKTSW